MDGKLKPKMGAFHTMNLPAPLLHSLRRLHYKQPTPIQRRTIPPLLLGHDVVGMARTGSGKTAAFSIPMVALLKEHCAVVGVRGLVVSPTRELAMQTGKALVGLCKGSDLRVGQIVGGETLEAQFAVLAQNPDILVVTPGRLLHLVTVETRLSLSRVQFVVLDEADRLFEMGFQEQLEQLMQRLPSNRQTALFSATMPTTLADFAAAGLRPGAVFVRLDGEVRVSPDLVSHYYKIRSNDRVASLMLLLSQIYTNTVSKLTIVFTATRHHVEYLHQLLLLSGYQAASVHGAMDQEARTAALHSFRLGKCPILVVTDVAARGLDIPMLDVVVNVDMPVTGKMFVHRVGRVARMGRAGVAVSLVSPDELPYYCDLVKFLQSGQLEELDQFQVDTISAQITSLHHNSATLQSLHQVMLNAIKRYHASRPSASNEAYGIAKGLHVISGNDMLDQIHRYKRRGASSGTVGNGTGTNTGTGINPPKSRSEYYIDYKPTTATDHYSLKNQLASHADRPLPTDTTIRSKPREHEKIVDKGVYQKWRKRHHVSLPAVGEQELDAQTRSALGAPRRRW